MIGITLLFYLVIFFLIACSIFWVAKTVNWVWLKPRRIEKLLRKQGFRGNSYRILYGDTKEMSSMIKDAYSKPIALSDDIVPRVLPFQFHLFQKYGEKTFLWAGTVPKLLILNPQLIAQILTQNGVYKKPIPNPLLKLLAAGLAGYEDEKWAKHRKIVSPAFYAGELKKMLPAMHQCCDEMVRKWEMLITENNSFEFDVQPYLERLTSAIICKTTFGNFHEQGKKIFELQKQQAELTGQLLKSVYVPGWRFVPTNRNRNMQKNDKELRSLIKDIIAEKEMAVKAGESDENSLLSMLLRSNSKEIKEHGKNYGMSSDEVIDECKVFNFAGQESSSNLLSWTVLLLSLHPTWQARARQEIRQTFGDNAPDYEGLNRLKIVTMILYEALRLYPPAVMFTREVHKDTKLGEMALPAGVLLMLPVLFVHHDPKLWGEDSKEFNPERFSQGIAKATKNQLSFFPFSWGPRICIGNNFALMEAKLALTSILRRFEFELSPAYIHAPSFVVTHRPQHGVHIILHKLDR